MDLITLSLAKKYTDDSIKDIENESLPSDAVLYVEQTLTPMQQKQARENIGAVSTNDMCENFGIEFVQGGVPGGVTDSSEQNRLKTGYISIDGVLGVACNNTNYQFYVHYYDALKERIGNSGGWVSSFNITDALASYPAISYVRIIARRTDNANLVPADVTGVFSLVLNKFESIKRTVGYTPLYLTHLYLTGDVSAMTKDNAVPLNYQIVNKGTVYPAHKGTCTCKWQGSSSVRRGYPKRNYTIKFDNPITLVDKWGSQKKYCLKANWVDPSACRNIVNAKLWGSIVKSRETIHEKLVASPNYGAIDGFPIVVVINDEFIGLYTMNVPKDGWQFNMGDGTAEYIVAGESNSKFACAFREEATFEGDEVTQTLDFSIEYKPDDVADSTVIESFNTAIRATINVPGNAEWENVIGQYVDIDSIIDYYIFVCCIGAYDNTRKNILYATYDGIKWYMSAYDLDSTFGAQVYGESWYEIINDRVQFKEAANWHKLFHLVYAYSKDKLKARYKQLRAGVLSNESVWRYFNNFVNEIPRSAYNFDAEKWPTMPATSSANVANYLEYYRMHCDYLDKEIEAL